MRAFLPLCSLLLSSAALGGVLPHTCASGSPSSGLPFCNFSLPFATRAADLLARVNSTLLVAMWSAPGEYAYYEPTLNLKAIGWWQSTVIHGVCGAKYNTTVFPHALAQAASFDVGLVARLGAATALEARIVNQLTYAASNGTTWANVIAAGGPLANTMHDARWGRAAECYGECPTLSAAMGLALLRAVQNKTNGFVAVAAVARHWLGYHEAQPDLPNGGREFIDPFSLSEQQEAPYKSLVGESEGVMCAMSAFAIAPRAFWNATPLIPSCLHPTLWHKLRGEWASDAFVQTDCCDSLTEAWDEHRYVPSLAAAITAGLEAGVEGSFGLTNKAISPTLAALLANGTVAEALLRTRLLRPLLSRFHAGEFDVGANPAYPFAGPFDEGALDGPAHRALAREAAAASLVLLRNEGPLLPLRLPHGGTLAVVGPWANCTLNRRTNDVDDPLSCNYLHSYTGSASAVSTVVGAAVEEAGWVVRYAQGSNLVTPLGPGSKGVRAAAAAAAAADVTVLCLGLGTYVEREGLDRTNLTLPPPQAELLRAVSAAAGGGRKLVLVLFSGGMVDLEEAGGARVAAAVVQDFYTGEETGHGVMDVLLGRVNPSARLPLTAFKQPYLDLAAPVADFALVGPNGVGRTHRFFNATAHPNMVSWWFGFGLSYSTFAYSNGSVALVAPLPPPDAPDAAPFAQLRVRITNTGSTAGAEVVQAYARVPPPPGGYPEPPKYTLAAFAKTGALPPGGWVDVDLTLPLRAFQTTDAAGSRAVLGGDYTVWVAGHLPDDPAGPSNVEALPLAVPPPNAPPPPALQKAGVFDAETGPSTILWWGGALVVLESIFCGYWAHAGQWLPEFEGHSYYRVRDFITGAVLANVSGSIGFAYGSGFVDYARSPPRMWVFGTPHDRCGHPAMPNNTGVWALWSDDPHLETWARAETDAAWNLDGRGANVDVASVLGGAPPGLPPHRFVMMTDRASFFVNNDAGGDLTRGWVAARSDGALPPAFPGGAQCPTIRYLPSDKRYYVLEGGHAIWLLRSPDLANWEVAGGAAGARQPVLVADAGDGRVAEGVAGNPATMAAADEWFREKGRNTSGEMLAHLENWDWNAK